MRKLFTTLCAAAMAMTGVASTTLVASAAPVMPLVRSDLPTTDVQEVQYRRRGFYRSNRGAYYNGHRGYRNYRRGYRRHNDFWFPAGAFIAGAIIGGALSQPEPVYRTRRVYRSAGGSSHVEWCYNRYRSYRSYDNTFQPYNGSRQQCYSPYN